MSSRAARRYGGCLNPGPDAEGAGVTVLIRFHLQRVTALGLGLGLVGALAFMPAQSHAQLVGLDRYKSLGPDASAVQEINSNGYTMFVVAGKSPRPGMTWANGTSGTPNSYDSNNTDGILRRAASWGIQVIASNSGQTGNGSAV